MILGAVQNGPGHLKHNYLLASNRYNELNAGAKSLIFSNHSFLVSMSGWDQWQFLCLSVVSLWYPLRSLVTLTGASLSITSDDKRNKRSDLGDESEADTMRPGSESVPVLTFRVIIPFVLSCLGHTTQNTSFIKIAMSTAEHAISQIKSNFYTLLARTNSIGFTLHWHHFPLYLLSSPLSLVF